MRGDGSWGDRRIDRSRDGDGDTRSRNGNMIGYPINTERKQQQQVALFSASATSDKAKRWGEGGDGVSGKTRHIYTYTQAGRQTAAIQSPSHHPSFPVCVCVYVCMRPSR